MKNYQTTKNLNITQYIVFSVLIFMPGMVAAHSGLRLIAIKMGALLLGSLGGFGLQKVISEMRSKKEKVMHLVQIIFLVLLVAFVANLKSF